MAKEYKGSDFSLSMNMNHHSNFTPSVLVSDLERKEKGINMRIRKERINAYQVFLII